MKIYSLGLMKNELMQLLYSSKFFSWKQFSFAYQLKRRCVLNLKYNTKNKKLFVFVRSFNDKKDYNVISWFIRTKYELDFSLKEIEKILVDWDLVENDFDLNIFQQDIDPDVFDNL
jgi:hypothetical protein